MSTLAGIDIGSSKICAIIAEKKGGTVSITGVGIAKSQGLKKGAVTNIDQAAKAIKNAITDAKRVAGVNITKANVTISGTYTKSYTSTGIVSVPDREIGFREISRAIQTAIYNAAITPDYEILHALPYNFKVDDQDFIEDPAGMTGSRIEVHVHIITTLKSNLENLRRTIKLAGVEIGNIVLSSYASSIAVLNDDERELGVAVIDIGGATSNLSIHLGTSLRYTDFMAVGSQHVTNDISMALHTPIVYAEKIKVESGTINPSPNVILEVPTVGDESTYQQVSLEVVSNVIFARVEETLLLLAKSLDKSGYKNALGAGVVITGGLTKLEGLRDLASSVFGSIPVRFARPKEVDGLFDSLRDPAYSSSVGLILYGFGHHTPYELDSNKEIRPKHMEDTEGYVTEPLEDFTPPAHEIGTKIASNRQSSLFDDSTQISPDRPTQGTKGQWDAFVGWLTRLF